MTFDHQAELGVVTDRSDPRNPVPAYYWRCSCFPPGKWLRVSEPHSATEAFHSHELLEILR